MLTQINQKLGEAHDAVNGIRDVTGQLTVWIARIKGREHVADVVKEADSLRERLVTIEEAIFKSEPDTDLHYTATLKLSGRLAALKFAVDFSNYAPTRQAVEVYQELVGKIDAHLARLREVLHTDLARLNRQIRDTELPAIAPRAPVEAITARGTATADAGEEPPGR